MWALVRFQNETNSPPTPFHFTLRALNLESTFNCELSRENILIFVSP